MNQNERSFGEIITFYSYKGGTGRSMALANVGYLLASDASFGSKRVLMIDWDLEAPGLQRFFFERFATSLGRVRDENYAPNLSASPGLIDFLTAVRKFYRENAGKERLPESMAREKLALSLFKEALDRFPLDDYILHVDGVDGLSLMKAGSQILRQEQDQYWELVRNFDWEDFYNQFGSFFTHFREHLMQSYDYVLIDSRTGLTDIGGICTRVMPEKLVAVFAPNHQNIGGIERVVRRSVEYRMSSRDPRGLMAFPLASRIDSSASKLRTIWWRGGRLRDESIVGYQATFENLFKEIYRIDECDLQEYFDATQIPHDSDYAYGEEVAALRDGTEDRFSIGHACAELSRRLVRLAAPWENLGDATEMARPVESEARSHVYISYRRNDTAQQAVDIQRALADVVGNEAVFVDLASVTPGIDFRQAIEETVRRSAAMLVLIGRNWLAQDDGRDRIGDPSDFVRFEVSSALAQGIPTIPVLVNDALLPTPADLPSELEALTRRNALRLRDQSWKSDRDRLVETVVSLLPRDDQQKRRRIKWLAAAAIIVITIGALFVWLWMTGR